ncbi:hypothetical protein GCM10009621_08310 [Corynebacterium felinum]
MKWRLKLWHHRNDTARIFRMVTQFQVTVSNFSTVGPEASDNLIKQGRFACTIVPNECCKRTGSEANGDIVVCWTCTP